MLITRSQFLGAKKRRYKDVSIPDGIELGEGVVSKGDTVRIQSLTARELDTYESSTYKLSKSGEKLLLDRAGIDEHRRHLVRLVLVDAEGAALITESDAIGDMDGLLIASIYREACKHCGIKELDEAAEKN